MLNYLIPHRAEDLSLAAHASSPDHESSEPSTSPNGSSDSSSPSSEASPNGSASDAVDPKPSIPVRGAAAGVWNDDANTAAFAAARNGFSARASGEAAAPAFEQFDRVLQDVRAGGSLVAACFLF